MIRPVETACPGRPAARSRSGTPLPPCAWPPRPGPGAKTIATLRVHKRSFDARRKADCWPLHRGCRLARWPRRARNPPCWRATPTNPISAHARHFLAPRGARKGPDQNARWWWALAPCGIFAALVPGADGVSSPSCWSVAGRARAQDTWGLWRRRSSIPVNVQFGEGGASTFFGRQALQPDQRIRHLGRKVMQEFVAWAPEEILYTAPAHRHLPAW